MWYTRRPGLGALGQDNDQIAVIPAFFGGAMRLPSSGESTNPNANWQCPPGEKAIWDDPAPEYLDGVRVDPPPQWVCVPEDPLEMIFPPGAPPCAVRPMRSITAATGEKGPWACPNACSGGRSAVLTTDLRWECPGGTQPKEGAFVAPSAVEESSETSDQRAEGERTFPWLWVLGGIGVLGAGYLLWRSR